MQPMTPYDVALFAAVCGWLVAGALALGRLHRHRGAGDRGGVSAVGWIIAGGVVLWLVWLIAGMMCVAARGDDTEERAGIARRS